MDEPRVDCRCPDSYCEGYLTLSRELCEDEVEDAATFAGAILDQRCERCGVTASFVVKKRGERYTATYSEEYTRDYFENLLSTAGGYND